MTDNQQYYSVEENAAAPDAAQEPIYVPPVYIAAPVGEKAKSKKKDHVLSLPARIGLWMVGVPAGISILFGCVMLWIWGLGYLGVIPANDARETGGNEFNYPYNGDEPFNYYDYFENYFDDHFGDYFGGGNNGGSDGSTPPAPQTEGTPGVGVTIQQIDLDFVIEDRYDSGLVILEIREDSSLAGTEAKLNDLIVAANGIPTPDIDTFTNLLYETGVGGEMTLTIARFVNGVASTFTVDVTLIDIG